MEHNLNLNRLERNTVAVIFQAGLVEIQLAMILIVVSMAMIFDDISYYIDIFFIVPIVFGILANKFIIAPRMGIVKLSKRRMRKTWLLITITTVFLVFMVTITIFGKTNMLADFINPRWIISGIVFFVLTAVAFFLNYDRMYIYAFLLLGAFNLSEEIRENPGIISETALAWLLASIVFIIIGCVYFIRFLKKYPLPKEGVTYEK